MRDTMRSRHQGDNYRCVIDGVMWDTATASLQAQSWYDETIDYALGAIEHPWDCGEKLYVNRWGRYFLYCFVEDGEWDANRIVPLSRERAIAWAEKNCPTEVVEEIFGPLLEAGQPEVAA